MTKKELAALLSGVDDRAEIYIINEKREPGEIEQFSYDLINNDVYIEHS